MKRFVGVLAISLCFHGFAVAAEKVAVQDRVVGGTFKTMAKAYIAAADIGPLKENNIKRIESMREDWFKQKYAEVYQVIGELPPEVRAKYRVKDGMTKREAIALIRSLDKKDMYEIIDKVPDPAIARQVNARFSSKEGGDKEGLMERVGAIWQKVVAEVSAPSER